jgi:hypothetical protein
MISTVIVHDEDGLLMLNTCVHDRAYIASDSEVHGSARDSSRMVDVVDDLLDAVCAVVYTAVRNKVLRYVVSESR